MRKILFYKGAGKSEREIATLMKRSKTAIYNELIRKNNSNRFKWPGRKRILAAQENHKIFQLSANFMSLLIMKFQNISTEERRT